MATCKIASHLLAVVFLTLTACSLSPDRPQEKSAKTANLYNEEDWITLPSGEFFMGAGDDDKASNGAERPQHKVTVHKPFKMARYEVTFGEYERFALSTHRAVPNDSGLQDGLSSQLPVINVSWQDANAYAAWLSLQTGKKFRLPTEAEWEYAARAGTSSKRFWGDHPDSACEFANVFDKRNEAKIRDRFSVPKGLVGNYNCEDAYFALAPVGRFKANPWGLHDMLGNVWEWVQDCQHPSYSGAPIDASIAWENQNGGDCGKRGVRGGSWFVAVPYVCSAYRSWNTPSDKGTGIGFRLLEES